MYERASDILNVPLATLNTMVLIGSSVTMVMSWASLAMQRFDRYRLYMGVNHCARIRLSDRKGLRVR